MIPLLWYVPGYFIAKGDYFPYLFSVKSLTEDFYLWSSDTLGNPSALPAYAIYGLLWAFLQSTSADIGLLQIVILMFYFFGATFSIIYLAKTVYPGENFATIIASIFYVFNFFAMLILLNIGMMMIYAFLPLLTALFMRALTQTENTYGHIIYFALVFTVVASVSSINFANVALIIISLGSISLYCFLLERKTATKKMIRNFVRLLIVTSLLSTWWIVPSLNYYVLSPSTQLPQEISVQSWSWTHVRASFLNLFWLNGLWGWRPEYSPYYNVYTNNAVLSFLLFIPFLLATMVLILRDEKSKLNAYLWLTILFFVFLAKGLHEPLSSVNLFLYSYIPFMSMFREPVSKSTLIMIQFLALLIGYATQKIAGIITNHKFGQSVLFSRLFMASVILIFLVSAFPLFTNPIETKTEHIPYSTYVKLPQYWYEASEWLSNNSGDYRILITPLDDYYQIPYVWGYYGADTFLERLMQKPIVNPYYAYSYKINPKMVMLLDQLRDAQKYNRTKEFETILGLLNVRYILQRNDLDYEFMASANRDIAIPERIKSFLSNQSNITLVKTIGKLDIYEYKGAQQYIRLLEPRPFREYDVEISNNTILSRHWDFNSTNQLDEWKSTTLENQGGALCRLHLDNASLRFELWNSSWGWKTIASPMLTARFDAVYNFGLDVRGENAHEVHIKMLEYDKKMQITHGEYVFYVSNGTFNWKDIELSYAPRIENTTFLQITIWNGHETDKPFPNIIWVDNVEIRGFVKELGTAKIQHVLETSADDLQAKVIEWRKLDPAKTVVEVNASEPFMLVVNEAYDPSWRAYVNGETYYPVPVFSVMNGFLINKTGQLKILIEYEPQRWFYYALTVSVVTLLTCLVYLTKRWAGRNALCKRISTALRAMGRQMLRNPN